jgi:hypothetical protein
MMSLIMPRNSHKLPGRDAIPQANSAFHRRRPRGLRWVPLVAAVWLVLACTTSEAENTPLPHPSRSSPVLSGTAGSRVPSQPDLHFPTVEPGGSLPGDEACARAVAEAPETVPANAPYNATPGRQGPPTDLFDPHSHDPRAVTQIASRITGAYTGSTTQILRWAACKWGVDENLVRAQAKVESSLRQTRTGDWTDQAEHCAPGHELGVDGRAGMCPESWGILQVKYQFFRGAFPGAITSTAYNLDTAYGVWRACYEGYESWLADFEEPGHEYRSGDIWGCVGRWYSGAWYNEPARGYLACVQKIAAGRRSC